MAVSPQSIVWKSPAFIVATAFPAGLPPSSPPTKSRTQGSHVLFLEFRLQLRTRLLQTAKRGDRKSDPIGVNIMLNESDEDEESENWRFRELVDSLMWLAIFSRLDISNGVRSVMSYYYCNTPKAVHWKVALGILAYINGISDFCITV